MVGGGDGWKKVLGRASRGTGMEKGNQRLKP